jgi:hypothetical protein
MSDTGGDFIIGASRSLIEGDWEWPVHGLRHPPEGQTSGWYVWTGDFSAAADFFQPWHTRHLIDRVRQLAPLLGLPPGSRLLFAPDHIDTWDDRTLLDV